MRGTGTVLLLAILGTAACAPAREAPRDPAPDVTPALARLDAELDRLEERLLASQSTVRMWTELQARHEGVSAVTCKNLSEHARAMALFDGRERRMMLERNRVATRFDPRTSNRR